jgi:5-methyltetrahydrofolate--homocysteine methyltransferase
MPDFQTISEKLQQGRAEEVRKLVQAEVAAGTPVGDILRQGLIAGMGVIGAKFKKNEVYVPEVLIAARAMHAGLSVLEPLLAKAGVKPLAKIAIGTVKGDLHDIGKNLVAMMLRGAGFEVEDLKIDVTTEKFIEAARGGAKLICLSALLTTTMPQMKAVVAAMKSAGITTPVIVGGAPVTQSYADEIGAQGYASDAASAVDVAKKLLQVQ